MVIPKEAREKLKIREGDKLALILRDDPEDNKFRNAQLNVLRSSWEAVITPFKAGRI
ncbi:MAG: AbrB/MazE/SpoVT family DNA-binding domain-containing protein [Archaeoglobaceae archaeon]